MNEVRALDKNVLAVAVTDNWASDDVCYWAAYIGAVQGKNHNDEWQEVRDNGSKLPEDVASVIFPEFAAKFRWRE